MIAILTALLALVPASGLEEGSSPPPSGNAPAASGQTGEVRLGDPASSPADAAPAEQPPDALGADVGEAGGPASPDRSAAPPETYTVRPGDTLWDLSGRFLNNPWYWPKIWSYNPEISNPHWIYPGSLLKFYSGAEQAPTRVEPLAPGTPIAEEEPEPVKELEDLSRGELNTPADGDAVSLAGPYKIGSFPSRSRYARRDAFVTPRELAESGAIHAAFEEKLMLSALDRAYATFQNAAQVKVGETYVVYKTERPIYHPVTKELFGYESSVLGSAKVVAVDKRAATLVIAQSFDPIERGAMLGPWTQKFLRPIDRKPNRQAVQGRIIGSQVDVVTQVGENHLVFVDKGQKDGVEEGNVFTVVRSGDQYGTDPNAPTWDPKLPAERIGDLLVVDVRERASSALVTRSMKELMVGDRVEMRPDGGSGGGSTGN